MEKNIILRKARLEDISLIRTLAKVCFYETYWEILSMEQLDYMYEMMYSETSLKQQFAEGHNYLLVFLHDECLGYVSYQYEGENSAHLHKLYILPSFHRKGIGEIMINSVFQKVKEHYEGASCFVELNVNRKNSAYNFYKKMGMYEVDSGDFSIGNGFYMCDYIMRKDL